jgi:hypothetical protein
MDLIRRCWIENIEQWSIQTKNCIFAKRCVPLPEEAYNAAKTLAHCAFMAYPELRG